MQASDIPTKFPIPFAANATGSFVRTIPVTTADPNAASLSLGWPPNTATQESAGGSPPDVRDENGILKQVTEWLQWCAAGGIPVGYDAVFSGQIGGYPEGALLASGSTTGKFWVSTANDNLSDPDSGGADWEAFPDVLIQRQTPNYGTDTGSVNSIQITLVPAPTALADLIGSPIRVKIANTTTNTVPTLKVNGLTPVVIVNPDGSPMVANEIVAGQLAEFLYDGTHFQILSALILPGVPGAGLNTAGASGYMILPNSGGIIFQWGNGGGATGNGDVNNFPIPFPNAILSVTVCEGSAGGWVSGTFCTAVGFSRNSTSLASFLSYTYAITSGAPVASGGIRINWMAIGR